MYTTLEKTREQIPTKFVQDLTKKDSSDKHLSVVLANTRSIEGKLNELQVLPYQYDILKHTLIIPIQTIKYFNHLTKQYTERIEMIMEVWL